ncbi:MAG: phosphotransferase family protein [Acidimicrobiia bacterium]|nr:phosphotransferase family protein [Acidimicrobiia bacterium]MYJ14401.1 phosphotransferase family protein [Acidimicrobiia bacterium]
MSTVAAAAAPEGIEAEAVTAWFARHVHDARSPLSFSLIEAGHSNMTFVVTDSAEQRWVLRRPPLHTVLATAHDMGREHRAIAALHPEGFPVPRPLGLCADPAVNGAPFYVMEHVEGSVIRDADDAVALSRRTRRALSGSLVDTLARLHSFDADAVGLGDHGRRDGYVARQLRRWLRQVNDTDAEGRPQIRAVHDRLAARVPPQTSTGIVHGDYRLDNCIVGRDGTVRAVLDWELCTLGDVMADVAMLLTYWSEPGEECQALDNAPTAVEGFYSRAELLEAYAAASGRSLERIDFYLAWGAWRLACILVGVQARYLASAMGHKAPREGIETFGDRIDGLLARAAHHASRVA